MYQRLYTQFFLLEILISFFIRDDHASPASTIHPKRLTFASSLFIQRRIPLGNHKNVRLLGEWVKIPKIFTMDLVFLRMMRLQIILTLSELTSSGYKPHTVIQYYAEYWILPWALELYDRIPISLGSRGVHTRPHLVSTQPPLCHQPFALFLARIQNHQEGRLCDPPFL